MATDHHSEEKYDRSRAKITPTINQTKPTILKDELEGIFPVIVLHACIQNTDLHCMHARIFTFFGRNETSNFVARNLSAACMYVRAQH